MHGKGPEPGEPKRSAVTALKWAGRIVAAVASIVFVLAVVQPLPPAMVGLDGSWRLALTMGALQHLQFGRDIVFTFGPLGYVLEGVPTPALATKTAYLTLMLALVAVAGAWTVCAGRSSAFMRAAFFGALIVTATTLSVDYVAFAGILALLARIARFPRLGPMVAAIVGGVGSFGLLSKQTLGLDVLAAATTFFVVEAIVGPRRRRISAGVSLAIIAVVVAAALVWSFGGNTVAVADYLRNSADVVLGFSAAMSSPGPSSVLVAAAIIALAIAASAVALARDGKAPFAAAAIVAVFLAWKHGVVREDGHVLYFFAMAPLVAALVGIGARRTRTVAIAAISTIVAFGGAVWMIETYNIDLFALVSPDRLAAGAEDLVHPIATARHGEQASRVALAGDRLSPAIRARIGRASVDVIPSETAIVAANGLQWKSPPVFQSYSAYTPRLDELDREMLANRGADIELVRYEDIDQRYPLSSEPATFAELLCRYKPVDWVAITPAMGAFMALARQPASRCAVENLGRASAAMNRAVDVPAPPNPNDVVRASFDLHSTFAGAVAGALWRPPLVWIEATFRDGQTSTWRLVAATARDGVIVSPMPRNAEEARLLFAGDPLQAAAVTSVRLLSRDGFYSLPSVSFTALHR